MKVVSSLPAAAEAVEALHVSAAKGCVISIGNFDGLHLGHQAILQTVVQHARRLAVPAVAMTFEPHPIQVLAPDKAPKRIHTPDQKVEAIAKTGIDLLFVARFDREFAALSPDDFVRQYLIKGLQIRAICVGANFNFGHRQDGTVATLRQWENDFVLIEIPPVLVRSLPASSTQIRKNVMDGEVSRAARLLGHWFEIEGRIVSGAGRGRNVTVPTLNLDPFNELIPKDGVYVTRIALDNDDDGRFLDAVTNIGMRPTFDEDSRTIETFVLSGAVPNEAVMARLQFLHRIRDEKRFDSPELLAAQIRHDVQTATHFFRLLRTIEHARTHSN